ncbi:hypothetical protein NC651_037577 [Populus alba x Populus x berolinensis]|nr:hypothetical protein NC651_037577 [Populus alba x Populus x berolinensis]
MIIKLLLVTEQPRSISSKFNTSVEHSRFLYLY